MHPSVLRVQSPIAGGLEPSGTAESLLHPSVGLGLESQGFFPLKSAGIPNFRCFWPLNLHHCSLSKLPPFLSSKAACSWGAGQSWCCTSPAPWLPGGDCAWVSGSTETAKVPGI